MSSSTRSRPGGGGPGVSARLQQVGTLLASRRAGPALGALLASYALIAGALITAYQWLQFWRQGHWTPLLVGSLWEYFVGSRPFFAVRESRPW